jgi:hypothetical protein
VWVERSEREGIGEIRYLGRQLWLSHVVILKEKLMGALRIYV